jgi:tetratricopeptide (TPR) repeat protein
MRTRAALLRGAVVAGLALALLGAGAAFLSGHDASPVATAPASTAATPAAGIANQPGVSGVIAALQTRLRAVPGDWQSLATLGSAYVEQARVTGDPSYYPKAQEALERSLTLNTTDNFAALSGLGALAAARHDFAAALQWADKGLAINPDNSTLYGVRTDALVELGRYDEAQIAVQKMADLRPDLPAYARASYLRELTGDVAGALQLMRAAESNADSPSAASFAIYHQGELKENAGQIDAAAADYHRAQQADPASLPAREGLARIAAARGRTAEAITAFEALVNERPLPAYAAALTDLYTAAGRTEEAAQQRELLAVQRKLLAANGVNSDLELALYSADNRVEVPQAVAAARAEWSRRKSVHVADALAWALYADGRFAEAKTYADQALRLGTQSAAFYFHRGMIEAATGDAAGARRDLAKALTINPTFSLRHAADARATLTRLGA